MNNTSFQIEEEFDPSLLGLESFEPIQSVKESKTDINVHYDNESLESQNVSNHPLSTRPLTALDLLRAITEPLDHHDLTKRSPLLNVTDSSDGSPNSETSSRVTSSTSETSTRVNDVDHEDPVVRDFADYSKTMGAIAEGNLSDDKTKNSVVDKADFPIVTTDSVHDNTSIEGERKPRPHIRLVRTRLPGSKRYRTAIRVYRPSLPETDIEETADESVDTTSEIGIPTRPEPNTQFQRDLSSEYGREILDKIEKQSKLDSTSGTSFPSILRDLFPALSDLQMTLKIVNVFRRQFDLPLLDPRRVNKIELKRSIAKMREGLYIDLISGLILPLAPKVQVGEDDEDGNGNTTNTDGVETEEEKVTLTPINLQILENKLPKFFSSEKSLIKNFLREEHKFAYGEKLGHVVWQGGIGKIRGKGEDGFRGKCEVDGNTHIFVDHSNILHGLIHHLYANPSDALPPKHLRTLSLPALSLLLRRGKFTPPGSLHLVASSPLQQNLDPLVRLGWEISVLKRVELYEDEIEDPFSMKVTSKVQTKISNHNELSSIRRFKEQGVDEILHLKILQILNEKSSKKINGNGNVNTLVLATGDARGGQFNKDGFPGAVREALKRGWNVELWSFTSGLSRAWRDIAKREKWYELGKFTIWAMDDWAEQLVEVGKEDFL